MKISEKINMGTGDLIKNGPITIVAFGDSVTHGAVGFDEIDYETVYWNRLKKMINKVRDYVPVNVINAGIGGVCAANSIDRMDSQVLSHNPDLIIVCFGLNDVNGDLDWYLDSMRTIFKKCNDAKVDTIFLTPNMLNSYVLDETPEPLRNYATKLADFQTNGKMDLFMEEACKLAEKMGIKVCDCYSEWKKLSETQDTTKLLANGINHPTREMHKLFAEKLFNVIFEDCPEIIEGNNNTMYEE